MYFSTGTNLNPAARKYGISTIALIDIIVQNIKRGFAYQEGKKLVPVGAIVYDHGKEYRVGIPNKRITPVRGYKRKIENLEWMSNIAVCNELMTRVGNELASGDLAITPNNILVRAYTVGEGEKIDSFL